MAYDREKAKKARFQRLSAESGTSSGSSCKKPKELRQNDYNTPEEALQEEIRGKFTDKRRRAINTAQIMEGIAKDIPRTVEIDVPMVHEFYRPKGYNHYVGRVLDPARHVSIDLGKHGPKTADWWEEAAQATADCGSWLEFHVQAEAWKLHKANFCRFKFCPYCMWRRSLKIFGQMSKVMEYLSANPETKDYRFVFLTLTQRNCTGEELPAMIDRMMKAWSTVLKWDRGLVFRGSFRTLEVTVNQECNTYHPHFHVIFAVREDYFWKERLWYLSHSDWMMVWRVAMKLDYDPSVRIERVKEDSEKGYGKAVAEVSKYAVKDSDFVGMDIPYDKSKEYLYTLANGLYNRRLLSWTGCFAKARQALGLTDPEADSSDLANDEIIELRDDVATMVYVYRWRAGVTGYYQRDEAAAVGARLSAGIADISAEDFVDADVKPMDKLNSGGSKDFSADGSGWVRKAKKA